MERRLLKWAATFCAAFIAVAAQAADKKPNILVIFGDDIGMWNISAYNRGMMGYRTPNIDRDKPILAAITWGSAV